MAQPSFAPAARRRAGCPEAEGLGQDEEQRRRRRRRRRGAGARAHEDEALAGGDEQGGDPGHRRPRPAAPAEPPHSERGAPPGQQVERGEAPVGAEGALQQGDQVRCARPGGRTRSGPGALVQEGLAAWAAGTGRRPGPGSRPGRWRSRRRRSRPRPRSPGGCWPGSRCASPAWLDAARARRPRAAGRPAPAPPRWQPRPAGAGVWTSGLAAAPARRRRRDGPPTVHSAARERQKSSSQRERNRSARLRQESVQSRAAGELQGRGRCPRGAKAAASQRQGDLRRRRGARRTRAALPDRWCRPSVADVNHCVDCAPPPAVPARHRLQASRVSELPPRRSVRGALPPWRQPRSAAGRGPRQLSSPARRSPSGRPCSTSGMIWFMGLYVPPRGRSLQLSERVAPPAALFGAAVPCALRPQAGTLSPRAPPVAAPARHRRPRRPGRRGSARARTTGLVRPPGPPAGAVEGPQPLLLPGDRAPGAGGDPPGAARPGARLRDGRPPGGAAPVPRRGSGHLRGHGRARPAPATAHPPGRRREPAASSCGRRPRPAPRRHLRLRDPLRPAGPRRRHPGHAGRPARRLHAPHQGADHLLELPLARGDGGWPSAWA